MPLTDECGILTQRAVMLAKIETTVGVDPVPTPSLDAFLVGDPDYSIDPNVLERNFTRNDLSPLGVVIGRKVASMTFTHEIRGNGLQQSGVLADAPKITRLIRACGYAITAIAGAATIGAVVNVAGNAVDPAWAIGGASTAEDEIDYTVTVVLGGITAVAEVRVTANNPGNDDTVLLNETFSASVTGPTPTMTLTADASDPLAVDYTVAGSFQIGDILNAVVGGTTFSHTVISADSDLDGAATALALVIDAATDIDAAATTVVVAVTFTGVKAGTVITTAVTAVALGGSGGTITPTWSGSLVLGDSWTVAVSPQGIRMDPISECPETITLYMYLDGVLHRLTGALGTFTLNMESGAFGTASFTFTGQYNAVTDATMPLDAVFETTLPEQVELAEFKWDGDSSLIVNALTYDQANNIVVRPDINGSDGFRGVRITGRNPTGTFDPEMILVADFDLWGDFATAARKSLSMRVGQTAGNTFWIKSPQLQMNSLGYGDREGLRTLDVSLRFSRVTGNDEVRFLFN